MLPGNMLQRNLTKVRKSSQHAWYPDSVALTFYLGKAIRVPFCNRKFASVTTSLLLPPSRCLQQQSAVRLWCCYWQLFCSTILCCQADSLRSCRVGLWMNAGWMESQQQHYIDVDLFLVDFRWRRPTSRLTLTGIPAAVYIDVDLFLVDFRWKRPTSKHTPWSESQQQHYIAVDLFLVDFRWKRPTSRRTLIGSGAPRTANGHRPSPPPSSSNETVASVLQKTRLTRTHRVGGETSVSEGVQKKAPYKISSTANCEMFSADHVLSSCSKHMRSLAWEGEFL